MPLSEAQIQRYARHILLPEVGGVGQERLLETGVRVRGEALFVELAGDYLSAAGVQVDAHSGMGLGLKADAGGVSVRACEGAIEVRSSGCLACVGVPSGPLTLEDGCIAATLAASELLVRVLALVDGPRAWRVTHGQVSALPFGDRCEAHQ